MAETSKNGIYYNDNENSIADVLADIKKLAESVDDAIEQTKYDDSKLKTKNTEQDEEIEKIKTKDINQDNLINQLQEENKELKLENSLIKEQIPNGNIVGNNIHIEDSSNLEMSWRVNGGHKQETKSIDDGDEYNSPSPDYPSEIETVKDNVTVEVCNKNYLNFQNKTGNLLGVDYECSQNTFKINGTTSYAGNINYIIEETTLKPGTYTFSYKCKKRKTYK